jgi:uncharacterized protein YecE (DUF72 family)
MSADLRIGTAGWTVPADVAGEFTGEGSGLKRYASRFDCAEINSSFHRSHRAATWERWAACVPGHFRFSAKLSKQITHSSRLAGCGELLSAALAEMRLLQEGLEVVLVQLPPSLVFDAAVAESFFADLRAIWPGRVACEPRHASWFDPDADGLLAAYQAARVAADPVKDPRAALPGGWRGFSYWRLHGSPVPYRSSYDDGRLELYAERLAAERGEGRPVWCIFDNTASSAAAGDALKLKRLLGGA